MEHGDVEAGDTLSPLSPPAQTSKALKEQYIFRARRRQAACAVPRSVAACSAAKDFGADYGLGVGLHLELVKWLRWSFLWMILTAVPFLIVIGTSVFTTEAQRASYEYGIKMYESYSIYSFSFAAIVDDTVDNGTLTWLNTFVGRSWHGPMPKTEFLIWVSLLDAGAILVFALGLAVLALHLRRLARRVDTDTLEVSDYTVLVRGLPPDVDAAQVGEHFSRFGEVMDVVLVTDRLAATLQRCGAALKLQQKRSMILDESLVKQKGNHLKHMQRVDDKLAGLEDELAQRVGTRRQHVRAAFVTYNSENERRACVAHCPKSLLSSYLQPHADRFGGSCRFWVRHACAPEDYRLENLAVSEKGLLLREVLIYFISLLVVLVCAAAIAKLTDVSNQERAHVSWYPDALRQDTVDGLAAPAFRGASAGYFSPVLASPSATLPAGALGGGNSTRPTAETVALACTGALNTCASTIQTTYGKVVGLAHGKPLGWANATARLVYERPVRAALQECTVSAESASGQEDCGLQACLPCLCSGWASPSELPSGAPTSAVAADVQLYCGAYLNKYDVRSWGIRLSISLVVAVLNWAIKWALKGLLALLGKHWTHTARERSYALQCFAAMLVNTVAVMLLVNSSALGRLAQESSRATWVRYFVQHGQYSDFTREWYENVGLSILILMMINTASPLVDLLTSKLFLLMLRFRVLHCACWPLQSEYDDAWSRPPFTLEQRTADLLLNVSLALLFGSGMPLCYLVLTVYLVVAEACDRWALTRLCGKVPRYGKGLSRLVMGVLPWLTVAHCAFGLWMHTYFKVLSHDETDRITTAFDSANAVLGDMGALQDNSTWRRITQANGLALFLLVILLAVWLVLGRYLLWGVTTLLGSCCRRVCCPKAQRLMRGKLAMDTAREVAAVPYGDALTGRLLQGASTYRLKHHPHYAQFFTASALNRSAEVVATLMAAAGGGPDRRIYTRLKSIQRGGRFPGPPQFRVLAAPLTTEVALALAESVRSSRTSLFSAASQHPTRQDSAATDGAPASAAKEPVVLGVAAGGDQVVEVAASEGGRRSHGDGDAPGLLGGPTSSHATRTPPAQAGSMLRDPDPCELLKHELRAQERMQRLRSHGRSGQLDVQLRLPARLSLSIAATGQGTEQPAGGRAAPAVPQGPAVEAGEQELAGTAVCVVHAGPR